MSVLKHVATGLVLGAVVTLSAGAAMAGTVKAGTLGWSYAEVGVGSCKADASTCGPAHPAVYLARPINQGFDHNASVSFSDPVRGSGTASADVGGAFLALPQMHAIAVGAPFALGAKSWNFAFVEGVIGYKWTGIDTTLAASTFVGTLNYSNLGVGYGQTTASLAFLDKSVADPAIGKLWSADDGSGGFTTTCASPGAEAIMTTGIRSLKGASLTAVTTQKCAGATLKLVHGENFYIWSRMEAFVFGNETLDASHTFKIDFAPGTSADLIGYITSHVTPARLAVPEPSTWAMLLLGFGGVGAVIRRRRGQVALSVA